jgi:hypothetical protein
LTSRPPPKPVSRAVGADEAVARQHDRQRVAAVRGADRARRPRRADLASLRAVAAGRAIRDLGEREPGAALERGRAVEVEREVEGGALAGEPLAQLAGGVVEDRLRTGVGAGGRSLAREQHAAQPRVRGEERQRPDRCVDPHAVQR